jgi:hypothetical protein
MVHIENSEENIICYHGPIDIDLVSFASNYARRHIMANGFIVGKIYKVFIELAQNVSYYSAKQHSDLRNFGSGIGWFRIDEHKDCYTISTGNIIHKEHSSILEQNCSEINSLNEEELRDLKRITRSQAGKRDIGAHIGLIQMGLLTGNPLDIKIKPKDNKYSFFTITTKVNKR